VLALLLAPALLPLWGAPTGDPAIAAFPGKNGLIAFVSNRVTTANPEGDAEIFTMNADGTRVKQLTTNAVADFSPAWSPNGKRLAFTRVIDGAFEVFTMAADGRDQTNRSANPANDTEPAWSPDGKRLAFRTDRDGNDEIYVMDADGGGQTNLKQRRERPEARLVARRRQDRVPHQPGEHRQRGLRDGGQRRQPDQPDE
jgi:TolB protein